MSLIQVSDTLIVDLSCVERIEKFDAKDTTLLLRELDGAVRTNDQELAVALVERFTHAGHDVKPVFDTLLKFAVSEDGALHAEKFMNQSPIRSHPQRARESVGAKGYALVPLTVVLEVHAVGQRAIDAELVVVGEVILFDGPPGLRITEGEPAGRIVGVGDRIHIH